jgi:hypothetical protein
MEIKVLGPGCPKCQQTEKVVKEAVSEAGVQANIEKVTNIFGHRQLWSVRNACRGGRWGSEIGGQSAHQGRSQEMD